jgi:hypothetical protein
VLGSFAYELEVTGVPASDVLAVVLRHADAEGRPYVVARLAGPGVVPSGGTLALDGALRRRLEQGELTLELMTRGAPFGAARARVILPP